MPVNLVDFPPGPHSRLPRGYSHILGLARQPADFLMKLAEYGEIAYYKVGPNHNYLLNHPDYIRDVLVTGQRNFVKGEKVSWLKHLVGNGLLTSEGDFWLRQRRLSQPAFHKKRIAAYAEIMTDYATKTRESWSEGRPVDIVQEMTELTLAVVAKTLLDYDTQPDNQDLEKAIADLIRWSVRAVYPLPLAETLDKLPISSTQRFRKALKFLDTTMYRIINERRASGVDRGDLLSMLIEATDDDGSRMSNEQLRDEIITFFLAGHDTTSLTLSWAWYLLAQHPAVEAKLHAELDKVLEGGRLPTFEDLPRLAYTEMVFSEVLRLYPPAYVVLRMAVNSQKIGNYPLPAGSSILVSPYVTHRNPAYFDNPEQFNPDRWTPEFKAKLPKYAYFPFGGGPRLCIGEPFAWMEGVLLLATLGQKWRLRLLSKPPIPIKPLITLRPAAQIMMQPELRQQTTSDLPSAVGLSR